MTLPPGLQAARESGAAWCTEKRFAELLDLIEMLAEVLDDVLAIGYEHSNELDFARDALNKYRDF